MSLNCSCPLLQINMEFIDEQRSADMLDALADLVYEQEQAMRETEQNEWDGVYIEDEISSAERNACDHYNERYVYPVINS
jgi:nucleosome binding factor SPN SPT16 subunit